MFLKFAKMKIVYYCTVVMVCINLGNSLEHIRNQSPSKERLNFFDEELLQVLGEKESGNMLVSPVSIKLVLGMLMEGADGGTAEEIRTALRLPREEEARRKEFNTWLSALQANDSSNTLKIANRIFLSDRYAIGSVYSDTLKKYYSGSVANVRFDDPKEASRTINDWVGDQTSQLISTIVEESQLQADQNLILTSAVYFKGVWSQPFASERSAVRCFYTAGNECKESLMMTETGNFNYGYISRLDAKAIVLPYKGGEFSMLLLLPSRKQSVQLLSRDLVHVSLSSVLSETKNQEVLVQIPQFEINYNEDLANSLKKLHVSRIFDRSANFSKMFENNFESNSVSRIYHSAKITVNEEGSEAAAGTGSGAFFVPLMGGTTTSFVANRPFLFFVINSATNLLLFAGRVTSPSSPDVSNATKTSSQGTRNSLQKTATYLSSLKNDSAQNTSEKQSEASKNTEKTFRKANQIQRAQPAGSKFKSIKPLLSSLRVSREGSSNKFGNSFAQNKEQEKRGKNFVEFSRARKRQPFPSDDWRHHVLLFS